MPGERGVEESRANLHEWLPKPRSSGLKACEKQESEKRYKISPLGIRTVCRNFSPLAELVYIFPLPLSPPLSLLLLRPIVTPPGLTSITMSGCTVAEICVLWIHSKSLPCAFNTTTTGFLSLFFFSLSSDNYHNQKQRISIKGAEVSWLYRLPVHYTPKVLTGQLNNMSWRVSTCIYNPALFLSNRNVLFGCKICNWFFFSSKYLKEQTLSGVFFWEFWLLLHEINWLKMQPAMKKKIETVIRVCRELWRKYITINIFAGNYFKLFTDIHFGSIMIK